MLHFIINSGTGAQNFLCRINPLCKLLLSFTVFIYSLAVKSFYFQFSVVICVLALLLAAGLGRSVLRILPLCLTIGGTMFLVSFYWGSGLEEAAVFAMRIIILFSVFIMFGATTDTSTFLRSLHTLKIPPHLSMGLLIVFRFIPVLAEEMEKISLSFSLRKKRSRPSAGVWYRGIMVPFIFRLFTLADDLTLALHVRGYNSNPRPTMFKTVTFHKGDALFLALGLLLLPALYLLTMKL